MIFTPTPDDKRHEQAIDELLHALFATEMQPTTNQLLDYELGLSTAIEAQRIERDLTGDTYIREELAQLQALNQKAVAVETSMTTRFLAWLRTQWPDHNPMLAMPQLPATAAALRGTTEAHTIYAAGSYRLALTIMPLDASGQENHPLGMSPPLAPGDYTIQGQLINQQQPTARCSGTVQLVTVTPENEPTTAETIAAEVQLDDFGFFLLPITQPGSYRLIVALPEHTIWIQELKIP